MAASCYPNAILTGMRQTMTATAARIGFKIEFEGTARCWKDADVCAIDLIGPKSQVSAESISKDSSLKAGRLTWFVADGTKRRELERISLSPEVAGSLKLTARVFEYYDNYNRQTMGLDGVIRPERRARRHDVPIKIAQHSELESGASYLIRVSNVGERNLTATFTKIATEPSHAPKPDESKAATESPTPKRESVATQGASELDTLSTSEINARYAEALQQLRAARKRADEAHTCKDQEGLAKAAANIASLNNELSRFHAAFKRRDEAVFNTCRMETATAGSQAGAAKAEAPKLGKGSSSQGAGASAGAGHRTGNSNLAMTREELSSLREALDLAEPYPIRDSAEYHAVAGMIEGGDPDSEYDALSYEQLIDRMRQAGSKLESALDTMESSGNIESISDRLLKAMSQPPAGPMSSLFKDAHALARPIIGPKIELLRIQAAIVRGGFFAAKVAEQKNASAGKPG
jgi:hypothetical protein